MTMPNGSLKRMRKMRNECPLTMFGICADSDAREDY
jgi:hypothetical protein